MAANVETMTTTRKNKKTRQDRSMLWYMINSVIVVNPFISDEGLVETVQKQTGYSPPDWLVAEARFVYSQKVKRGELPPPEGYASLESVKHLFNKLALQDRARFVDWVQFEMR